MPEFDDRGHRPHAVHTGEDPRVTFSPGPNQLKVTLDAWGPQPWDELLYALYNEMQSNWGEAPERLNEVDDADKIDTVMTTVEALFAGKTLPQPLELITFAFTIDGCSRATTHQLVRTRIGAGFMQHGGRDNDWRHRGWTLPETVRRAFLTDAELAKDGLKTCVTNYAPLETFVQTYYPALANGDRRALHNALAMTIKQCKDLYAALVDAGIPWQDARRVLPMGTQTYIHANYTYPALAGVLANRLEHVMDWEINCVAQLMLREIKLHCPPLLSKYLKSRSDAAGRAAFAGLESWPPDGKYPNPYERCAQCGHAQANHDEIHCEVCDREGIPAAFHPYEPQDMKPRTHRPEQNPFWILHPDSMAGGPVQWIPTNGVYPHEVK